MKSAYPKIFEPITIKRTTIKNRIAMTPMGTNYGETSGEMSNRHMNYYSLRAKGGVGLIILENANIEYPVGSNGTSQIRIDHDSFMPRYYQLVENLHKNGATEQFRSTTPELPHLPQEPVWKPFLLPTSRQKPAEKPLVR